MMKCSSKKNVLYFFLFVFLGIILFGPVFVAQAETTDTVTKTIGQNARVDITNTSLLSKIAPGDVMPISVKLLNFGGGTKVDAIITYQIKNQNGFISYRDTETVAVETTASFVKSFPILKTARPGVYFLDVSIEYPGQVAPATTEFSFVVEQKVFGLFLSDFILYAFVTLLIGILMGIIGHFIVKRYRISRLNPLDYADIPSDERVFYELVSDTILGMRKRVGDVALDVATGIQGLSIEQNTGRVLKISDDPSKIMALLVSGYDEVLGKKVSFSFRQRSLVKKN